MNRVEKMIEEEYAVANFLMVYTTRHGKSPDYEHTCKALGLRNKQKVFAILCRLRDKGIVTWEPRHHGKIRMRVTYAQLKPAIIAGFVEHNHPAEVPAELPAAVAPAEANGHVHIGDIVDARFNEAMEMSVKLRGFIYHLLDYVTELSFRVKRLPPAAGDEVDRVRDELSAMINATTGLEQNTPRG